MSESKQSRKHTQIMKGKLLLIIMLCSISFISLRSLSVYGLTGNVNGFIENKEGESVGVVKVQLISGSSIIASYTSASNGYFYMNNINYGSYTITFSKSGYAETKKTITIQNPDTQLGTIVLQNAIELSTSTLNVITNPDAQITVPFTIQNLGTSTQIIDLLTDKPEGWYSRICTNNYEVTKVSLDAGQSMSLQLELAVSSTASIDQEYNVSITALGPTNSSLIYSIQMRNQSSSLPTLNLDSSILSMVANSGEKLVLPFTVTNIGDTAESIHFSVTTPKDWSTRILTNNHREITIASLSVGASTSFNLELIIPLDFIGDTSLTLTISGNTVASLNFTLNVEPVSESIMFCRFPGKSALPGDIVIFDVSLNNPFNVETRFKISTESTPSNWTVYITSNDEAVTEIVLGPTESVDLTAEVCSVISAATGENYEIIINAESHGQAIGSLPLTVSLQDPGEIAEIGVSTKYPEITVEAGKTFDYQLTLGNFGSLSRIVLLSVQAPADWKAVIKSGTSEISQLNIAPATMDGFEELFVEVTPPSTVGLDTYNITVQVRSESGAMLADLDLKATITGSYTLYLSMSTLLTSATSGESTSCTATLTNRGYSTLSAIGLEFEAEDGWDIKVNPSQIDLLRPQESCYFDVMVETPKDTVAGDYLVTLTGLSDQIESNSMQVRVTVNASTSWGIFGFGLAIVIIVALILVFKKFKRR